MNTVLERNSIGEQLRSGRREHRLSIEELSRSTRIPVATLHLLEEERFDELPGDLFVRGFLKSYAEAVGLDSRPIVQTFESNRPPAMPQVVPRPSPLRRRRMHLPIALATATVLALIAVVFSMMRLPAHQETTIELSSAESWPTRPCVQTPFCSVRSITANPIESSLS